MTTGSVWLMFDVDAARAQFPALASAAGALTPAYLDGPGGTQTPLPVIDAMAATLRQGVSNLGGGFGPSDRAEALTTEARVAVSDLVGAEDSESIVFGQNMTSLTFSFSRALSRTWSPGDRIIVTSLDHDANVSPWRRAAEDRGVAVDVARFDTATFRLDVSAVADLLTDRTRMVAFTHASNAVGTVPDVDRIVDVAHEAGALTYIDAVHFAPHGLVDVRRSGTDFLAASSYKFFGPHTGFVYGAREQLESLDAYKVRPAPSVGAGKWETGTQSFESLAGVTAAVDYLASLGEGDDRRSKLADGYRQVDHHLRPLIARFLEGLPDSVDLYGIRGVDGRTPTFAIRERGVAPRDTAARLIDAGLYVWHGHYYAIEPMKALGLLDDGGAVRIGFVHTTTSDEVERALDVLTG